MSGASVLAMSVQLKELRERAAASTAALRVMAAQGDEVEALVKRKRSLKALVVELRSEVRLPAAASAAPPARVGGARGAAEACAHTLHAGGHADAPAQGLEHGRAESGRKRACTRHGTGKHAQGA